MEDIDDDVYISRSNNYLDHVHGCQSEITNAEQQSKSITGINKTTYCTPFGKWYLETKRFKERLNSLVYSSQAECFKMQNDPISNILLHIGKYFFEKGMHFEAKYYISTARKMYEVKTDSTNSCIVINCIFWIGKCLIKNKDYSDAEKKFLEAISLYRVLPCSKKSITNFEGDCFKEIGVCQQKQDLYEKAAKSFETAVNFYYASKPIRFEDVSFCLLIMGRCLYRNNKFKDALEQFKKLLKIYSRNKCVSEISKGDCFFHIGRCLQNLVEYENGKVALLKAINVYQKDMKKPERSKVYKALTLFRIGKSFNMIQNHEEAVENFLSSLHLWEKLSESYLDDKEHVLKIAVSHKLIGRCYSKYNLDHKAIEHYHKSLESFQTLKHDKDVSTIICKLYRFLGKAYRELENYEVAYKYFTKGISEASETTSEKILAALNRNCGICLTRLNKSDEAFDYINVSLGIYEKLYKKEDYGEIERDIGLCYKYLNNFTSTSKVYLQKYVNSFEDSKQLLSLNNRFDIATVLRSIGLICQREKDWESTLDYFQQSLKILQKLPKSLEYVHQIAWLNNRIGKHWLVRYREKRAEKYFQNAIALTDSLSQTPKGIYMLAVSYKYLGSSFLQLQSYSKAVKNFQEAEKLLSSLPNTSKHYVVIAWLFKNIGICFKEQKWYSEALINLKEALKVYKKMLGKEECKTEIAFVWTHMGLCHQMLQNFNKALKKFKKSLLIYHELKGREHNVALILTDIGICYEGFSQNRRANVYFKLALMAFKKLSNSDQFGEKIIFLENKLDTRQYKPSQQRKKI